mgnify:CR=1 FL=1
MKPFTSGITVVKYYLSKCYNLDLWLGQQRTSQCPAVSWSLSQPQSCSPHSSSWWEWPISLPHQMYYCDQASAIAHLSVPPKWHWQYILVWPCRHHFVEGWEKIWLSFHAGNLENSIINSFTRSRHHTNTGITWPSPQSVFGYEAPADISTKKEKRIEAVRTACSMSAE